MYELLSCPWFYLTFEEIIAPQTLSTITESPFFEYFLTCSAIMRQVLISDENADYSQWE